MILLRVLLGIRAYVPLLLLIIHKLFLNYLDVGFRCEIKIEVVHPTTGKKERGARLNLKLHKNYPCLGFGFHIKDYRQINKWNEVRQQ